MGINDKVGWSGGAGSSELSERFLKMIDQN